MQLSGLPGSHWQLSTLSLPMNAILFVQRYMEIQLRS